jgi:hypothetical protein
LENKSNKVLRALISHVEPEDQKEARVRTAHRYLSDRTNQLDDAGARAAGLARAERCGAENVAWQKNGWQKNGVGLHLSVLSFSNH